MPRASRAREEQDPCQTVLVRADKKKRKKDALGD